MPTAVVERCIKAGSKPGDTILDPFAGAATTLVVADRLQRHAIGIELSPEYCAMARRRIEADAGMFAEVEAA
jgi:DNA modification methylase